MSRILYWTLLLLGLAAFFTSFSVVHAEEVEDDVEVADEGDAGAEGDDVEVFDDEDEEEYDDEEAYDDEEEYYDDDEVIPSEDVDVAFLFPEYADKRLVIGEPIELLVAMSNKGGDAFTVTSINAYLHSPFDYSYYIQNFTGQPMGVALEPYREVTLEYKFMADPKLEPLEFHFSAHVSYNDTEGRMYQTYITNSTIEFIEKETEFDVKVFLTYFFGIAAVILGAYVYLQPSAKAVAKTERGTKSSSSNEWGEIYTPAKKSKAVKRSSSKRKKASRQ